MEIEVLEPGNGGARINIVEAKQRLDLSPAQLARIFATMYDESQADFFEELGKIFFDEWEGDAGPTQLCSIARHMRTCECVTEEHGLEVVSSLAYYCTPPEKR